jgi:hypothetical protein
MPGSMTSMLVESTNNLLMSIGMEYKKVSKPI